MRLILTQIVTQKFVLSLNSPYAAVQS